MFRSAFSLLLTLTRSARTAIRHLAAKRETETKQSPVTLSVPLPLVGPTKKRNVYIFKETTVVPTNGPSAALAALFVPADVHILVQPKAHSLGSAALVGTWDLGTYMLGPKLGCTGSILPDQSPRIVWRYKIKGDHGWCLRKAMRDDVAAPPQETMGAASMR